MAAYSPVQLVAIADIEAGERYRKDPTKGIDALAKSIDNIGLLHPIIVLPPNGDARYPLVTGQRRILAHEKLNMDVIEARVASDMDEAEKLLAELDENVCRQNMTPGEATACKKAREELLKPLAEERKTAGLQKGRSAPKRKLPVTEDADAPADETPAAAKAPAKKTPAKKPRNETTADTAAKGTGYSARTLAKVEKMQGWAFDSALPQSVQEFVQSKLDEIEKADKPKIDPVYTEVQTVVNAAIKAVAQKDTPKEDTPSEPVVRDQAKVLKAAITGVSRHAKALQTAFLGADNLDADVTPDMLTEGLKELRLLTTSINKTIKSASAIIG